MKNVIQTEAPPLHQDEAGALRVGNSRVLLELIVAAFEDGATPEAIAQQYPSTSLSDIYGVIAYFLRHRDEVDQYMAEREQTARRVRQQIDARQGDLRDIRTRLLLRQGLSTS